jgi:hypothetical protein
MMSVDIYDKIVKTSKAMAKLQKHDKSKHPSYVRDIQNDLIHKVLSDDVIDVMDKYIFQADI